MATLNIGLAVRDGRQHSASHAAAVLRIIGGAYVTRAEVHESDTEPTLVAEVRRPLNYTQLFAVARALQQDAVAQWDGSEGHLVGPNAAAWGTFNPAYFLDLKGRRLAVPSDALKVA